MQSYKYRCFTARDEFLLAEPDFAKEVVDVGIVGFQFGAEEGVEVVGSEEGFG